MRERSMRWRSWRFLKAARARSSAECVLSRAPPAMQVRVPFVSALPRRKVSPGSRRGRREEFSRALALLIETSRDGACAHWSPRVTRASPPPLCARRGLLLIRRLSGAPGSMRRADGLCGATPAASFSAWWTCRCRAVYGLQRLSVSRNRARSTRTFSPHSPSGTVQSRSSAANELEICLGVLDGSWFVHDLLPILTLRRMRSVPEGLAQPSLTSA